MREQPNGRITLVRSSAASKRRQKCEFCFYNNALYPSFFYLFDFAIPWEASNEMQFLANRNDSWSIHSKCRDRCMSSWRQPLEITLVPRDDMIDMERCFLRILG